MARNHPWSYRKIWYCNDIRCIYGRQTAIQDGGRCKEALQWSWTIGWWKRVLQLPWIWSCWRRSKCKQWGEFIHCIHCLLYRTFILWQTSRDLITRCRRIWIDLYTIGLVSIDTLSCDTCKLMQWVHSQTQRIHYSWAWCWCGQGWIYGGMQERTTITFDASYQACAGSAWYYESLQGCSWCLRRRIGCLFAFL